MQMALGLGVWERFYEDSSLERDLLRRALNLTPATSDGAIQYSLDLRNRTLAANINATFATSTIGPTAEGCIQLLSIRPLLTGSAWKVLDLMIDAALDEIPRQRKMDSNGNPCSREISKKEKDARKWPAKLRPIQRNLWDALAMAYAETVELRHSLIHRRVHVDESGTLVGYDNAGASILSLSVAEQEAFAMAVLYASELLLADRSNQRLLNCLTFQLGRLEDIHKEGLPVTDPPSTPVELTILVGPDEVDTTVYVLDLPRIRAYPSIPSHGLVDLRIRPADRENVEFSAWLEDAPDEIVRFQLHQPPAWFRSQ